MSNGGERLISGRYLLIEKVGSGGMGTVWRATDKRLNRLVAVKELNVPNQSKDVLNSARRALREAHTIARISHPHVVGIHDLVDHGDRLWIVMELVAGTSLADHLRVVGTLPPTRVAEIGLQLLDALGAVHAIGALHRDVKPSNVLLRETGHIVLCDFGIVDLVDGESLTTSHAVIGSVEYMAPERLHGQPAGPPSDLFSLGVTLCALVSGRSPFARPEVAAVMHAVAYEEPDIPDAAGPLRPLIESLLSKDPAARPSPAAAAGLLRSVRATEGAPGRPAPPGAGENGVSRRNRRLRWTVLLVIPLLASGVATAVLLNQESDAKDPAEDPGREVVEKTRLVDGPLDQTGWETSQGEYGFTGEINAVMPAPIDENQRWFFSGTEYVRVKFKNVDITQGEPVWGAWGELDKWSSLEETGFTEYIDAVMQVPNHENQYWVFSGDKYLRLDIIDGETTDELKSGPRPQTDWKSSLVKAGFTGKIDAVMQVPNHENQYWVFSGDEYIRLEAENDETDKATLVSGPHPQTDWKNSLVKAGFTGKIDAVTQVPNHENQYWVFSGKEYIRLKIGEN
ncbi:protein kinase domain-containing protein [Streptomyces aculeolatus]